MKKKTLPAESVGFVFIMALAGFLNRLYVLSGGGLIGIMFGSVNDSVWENLKPVALSFLIWSALEIGIYMPRMKRFSVIRTAAVPLLSAVYIICRNLLLPFMDGAAAAVTASAVSVISAFVFSRLMMRSRLKPEKLFAEAMFFLLLLTAVYLSFTVFPPDSPLFTDSLGHRGIYNGIQ